MSISSLIRKREELMDTFIPNKGFDRAFEIVTDELKREAVEEKMKSVRASSSYERGAKAYYDKHGTSGEY